LLSTHDVNTVEDAPRLIDWYRQRWRIEQLFRTVKRQQLAFLSR
jgi:IS4 transposase